MSAPKAYLGDAVYVQHDGYGLVLTTENGIRATNTVYLEPEVWAALVAYVGRITSAPRLIEPAIGATTDNAAADAAVAAILGGK